MYCKFYYNIQNNKTCRVKQLSQNIIFIIILQILFYYNICLITTANTTANINEKYFWIEKV